MITEESWKEFCSIVHKAVRTLGKKDVTHAEAFFTSTETTEVAIRNSEILTQNQVDDSGVGFRFVVPGNKVGFACTNELSEKGVMEAAEKSFAVAKVSSAIPDFALPEASQLTKMNRWYDSEIDNITVDFAVGTAKRAIDSAENLDKRVRVKGGHVLFMSGWRGITNTLGVDFDEKETKAAIELWGTGEQGADVTGSCGDLMLSRKADLKPEEVGQNVAKKVTEMFSPKPLKSFQGTVIFGSETVSYQICDVLTDALKGGNVITGRSPWGKIGEEVGSETLTVTDNAVLKDGFASRSFDDEGCRSQDTELIRKGELRGLIHNATSAKALGTKNTGNASRFAGERDMVRMIIGNGYRTKPEIYPSNLLIQPGSKTKEQLVSEVTKGVLVESMAGFAQEGSGMISAQLSRAFYIQNGEVQHPIRGGIVSGSGFEWLRQVSCVSKDSKQFPNSVVPSLVVENVRVIGA
jgi:PmbA protein